MKAYLKYLYSATVSASLLLNWGCSSRSISDREKAEIAIKYAENNANELRKVIIHYSKDPSDSLKVKAAYFLIANMPGKGCYKYKAIDDNYKLIDFDSYCRNKKLNIYDAKKIYEDSAKTTLAFINPVFNEDIKVITADYLIENIDFAFKTWRLPLSNKLNFDQFKELILPYRINQEPLQNWRKTFFYQQSWVWDSLKKTKIDRFKAVAIINDNLKKYYWYKHDKISFFPGQLTLEQIKLLKGGRCEDLNMLVGYWLRSIGVPIASEYTSYWANGNFGGHSWLSVLDQNNKFTPFNSLFDNPIIDSLPFKDAHLSKAYRETFQINDTDFLNFAKSQVIPLVNHYDITLSYLPVSDVTVKINIKQFPDQKIWLGVLNGNSWKPLETQSTQSINQITFKNIGRNILYAAIVRLSDNQTKTVSVPFFLSEKGKVYSFVPDTTKKINAAFPITSLVPKLINKLCRIYYWDNNVQKWLPTVSTNLLKDDPLILQKKHSHKTLDFQNLPANAIYRVIDNSETPNELSYLRPFIYNPENKEYIDY